MEFKTYGNDGNSRGEPWMQVDEDNRDPTFPAFEVSFIALGPPRPGTVVIGATPNPSRIDNERLMGKWRRFGVVIGIRGELTDVAWSDWALVTSTT